MGVLNVTPDSFSDGGRYTSLDAALEQAVNMARQGAAIIDVGGESTRPGAQAVSEQEELDRVVPVIERLVAELPLPVSIDTSKPRVMSEAVAAGAGLINDVSALQHDDALETAAGLGVPVCLMHMQGEPRTMQAAPHYDDVVTEVRDFLAGRLAACRQAGISGQALLVDPGFGFGKTLRHNLSLLKHLDVFAELGVPLLVGMSRKRMIGEVLDAPVEGRLHGSLAVAVMAAWQGASIIRAHDVGATVEAMKMVAATRAAS